MNVVLTFGTFDLFHPGHEFFLRTATTHGDRLVVVVARDENVLRIKGKNPIDNEKKRVTQVKNFLSTIAAEHLAHGYDVMLGNKDWEKRLEILYNVSPDTICLGYDQEASIPDGAWNIITLGSYHPEKFKSSLLRKNITDSTK